MLELWTDGACQINDSHHGGGWGYVIVDGVREIGRCNGYEYPTTNNRMEMTAVIEGLKRIPKGVPVTVYSDSNYVVKGVTQWMKGWIKKGWKTAMHGNGDVKNKDLWLQIKELNDTRNIRWEWVKAHAGHLYNEIADTIAVEANLRKGTTTEEFELET